MACMHARQQLTRCCKVWLFACLSACMRSRVPTGHSTQFIIPLHPLQQTNCKKTLYAQGVGKTTACGKLAAFLKKRRKSVLMVATDVYRPAAIDQLVKLGSKVDVPVFELGTAVSPVEIARQGVAKAKAEGIDVVIVDTAGRLQVRGCVGEGSWRVCGDVRDVDSLRGGGVMIEVAEVV